MSEHRKVCDVEVKVVSNGREACVIVIDEYNEQYEVPIEVLKGQIKDWIFLPAERKDKRFRPKVERFGY